MGSQTEKKMGADGRGETYYMNPLDLVLVSDPKSPLFDERMKLPINQALVDDIAENGVQQIVLVRKNGEVNGLYKLEVIDGRQRVRACRLVNEQRVKDGKDPYTIKVALFKGSDAEVFEQMVRLNQFRQSDSPIMLARKMIRYINSGFGDHAKAAKIAGLHPTTLERYLELLDLAEEVQDMLHEQKLPLVTAVELGKLPRDEQAAAAQKLLDEGAVRGDAARYVLQELRGPEALPVEVPEPTPEAANEEVAAGAPAKPAKLPKDTATDKPHKPAKQKPSAREVSAILGTINELPKPNRWEEGVRDALLWLAGDKTDIPKEFHETFKALKAEVREKAKAKAEREKKKAEKKAAKMKDAAE